MPQTPRNRNARSNFQRVQPGQDVLMPKKRANFPGIGVTLSAYEANSPKLNSVIATKPVRKRRLKRTFAKLSLKRTFISLLLLAILLGGYFGGRYIYDLHKAFGGSIFGLFHTSKLKGEDSGRVNILLAGEAGQNSGQTGGPDLTDSIMLLSIDTKNNRAWMLSIPRDLWVNASGRGYQKINSVYENGQAANFSAAGYPSGGMGELERVVSRNLGVPINYYSLINYAAFKQAVDAVGGVRIDIQSPDPRGLFDAYTNLKLPNGWVTLNGQQALNLARARGDDIAGDVSYGFPQSDFDRTLHQRQLLEALKTKVTSTSVISNPIALSKLFDALGNNVKTDLTLSDARRLYDLSKAISNNKIQSLSLNNVNGHSLLTSYLASDGEEALVPAAGVNNYGDIQSFIAEHSSDNPLIQEGAKVVVLNGTSVSGLATKFKQKLQADHLNVDRIGDAYGQTTTTQIIDASGGKKPATKAILTQTFGSNLTTVNPYASVYNADFIIVLGSDQAK